MTALPCPSSTSRQILAPSRHFLESPSCLTYVPGVPQGQGELGPVRARGRTAAAEHWLSLKPARPVRHVCGSSHQTPLASRASLPVSTPESQGSPSTPGRGLSQAQCGNSQQPTPRRCPARQAFQLPDPPRLALGCLWSCSTSSQQRSSSVLGLREGSSGASCPHPMQSQTLEFTLATDCSFSRDTPDLQEAES